MFFLYLDVIEGIPIAAFVVHLNKKITIHMDSVYAAQAKNLKLEDKGDYFRTLFHQASNYSCWTGLSICVSHLEFPTEGRILNHLLRSCYFVAVILSRYSKFIDDRRPENLRDGDLRPYRPYNETEIRSLLFDFLRLNVI